MRNSPFKANETEIQILQDILPSTLKRRKNFDFLRSYKRNRVDTTEKEFDDCWHKMKVYIGKEWSEEKYLRVFDWNC